MVLVGTGAIAGAHAGAVAEHADRAVVVGAVDLDGARAAAFADRHGVEHHGTDLGGVLEAARRGGPVDLVLICTPPASHVPLAVEALESGVPVLLEKPPALSLAEVDDLLDVSRRTGVDVGVVFQHRFGAAALRAQRLLGTGGATPGTGPDGPPPLGRALVATCQTLWFRDPAYFAVPWRGRWAVEGGGPTMGHGIHQMDLLLALLGPWSEVTAMAGRQARVTDTEDVSAAVVRFESGALASVVASLVSPRETSVVRVDAEHATLELEHLYGYTDEHWTFTPAPGREDLAAAWVTDPGAPPSGHAVQIGAVLDALDAGLPLPVPLAVARTTLELVAAVYASAFTGAPVRRGEIGPGHAFHARMDGTGAPWEPAHRG